MLDWILYGGTVIDGTGAAPFCADVAWKDGKITAVGRVDGQAAHTLDARGLCVTPGFLDIHRHGDAAVFRADFGEAELRQGLTTVVNGACGLSLAPFGAAHREELLRYLLPITGAASADFPTESMAAYLDAVQAASPALNVSMMAGGGTVRTDVCGYAAGDPHNPDEISRRLLRALDEGALAVSLGLGYAPECFYSTEGLIRVLSVLRGRNIPVTVHMREEGDKVCDAIREMLTVARAVDAPLHISHLKAMGPRNWRKRIPEALELLRRARAEGTEADCDLYLYEAGSTQLLHLLPPEFLEGGTAAIVRRLREPSQVTLLGERIANGRDFDNIAQMVGWDNIVLSTLRRPEYADFTGKTLAETADALNMEPVACLCRILADEDCAVTMIDRINCEDDIRMILQEDYSSVISDATYPTRGLPHPRVYGNATRLLERYVMHERLLTLPQAVRKLTGLPAAAMRMPTKGVLREGMDADLCVFRPEALHECASFAEPRQFSEGMDSVFVNGQPAILHGERTALRSGRVLRRFA